MHDGALRLPSTPRQSLPLALQAARTRPDVLLFSGAAAVVALHATVDSYIAPEPGTNAGDHLLRGLVTLGVLALAAAAYPRLSAGARAAVAAALGALALEGAGLAIADARSIGARGEDWSGFLLAPVGVALVGLALVLLWRSRKPGHRRWLRRGAIAVGTLIAAYWLLLPVGVAILATHRPREDMTPVRLGRPYEQVTVTTADGLQLAGWYVRSRNGAAVLSYPTRKGKVPQARMLVRHGYGVLLLDARGYDGSQGDPNVFGWEDAKDIDAAVAWLRDRRDVKGDRIGGIGFSVGGEMMLQAAAANPGLRAVVSDGAGFRSVREEVLYGPSGWFTSVPEQAVQSLALTVLSGTVPPPSLKDLVPRIAPRHVFFIYAGHGAGGEEYNHDYYAAARAPKTIWKIPEAGHTGGYQARPREYEQRVVEFLDHALLGKAHTSTPAGNRLPWR